MKIIGAFNRFEVSGLEPRKNSVLIMITTTITNFPKLNEGWADVLKLKFDDVEGRDTEIGGDNLMTNEQAKKILDFAVRHINKDLFVSCDAGISRSTAIVVALEQIFNGIDVSDSERLKYHNRYVKNKIRDVWFKSIWRKK